MSKRKFKFRAWDQTFVIGNIYENPDLLEVDDELLQGD